VFPHEIEGLSAEELREHRPEMTDIIDKLVTLKALS
jgi:hypothetical protein